MGTHAFVDESARRSTYHVCAAIIEDLALKDVRRLAKSYCLPGQRRWHFVHERDSRRRQIIDAIVNTGHVTAAWYFGRGSDSEVRAASFRRMIDVLLDRRVGRLVIESRERRDGLDRRVLISELRRRKATLPYEHLPARSDPALWIADALAWCSSAGGEWQQRTQPITLVRENLASQ